jgi:uncharacterized protein YabE (DUF348 family)
VRPSFKTIAINASVVTALVGGGVAYMSFNNAVALTVDGETETVHTFGNSVGSVLESQGIEVGDRDEVVPSLDSKIEDGTEITVRYGREVTVTIDGEEETFWTTALSVEEALAELDIRDGADLSVARSLDIGRSGLDFEVRTPKDITLIADGDEDEQTITALTVREALAAFDVELGELDIVEPSLETKLADESEVIVKRVTVERETVEVDIDFDSTEKEDDSLEVGKTSVATEGKKGLMEREVEKTYIDGELEEKETLSETVVAEPVTEVVLVGTKQPAPPPVVEEEDDSDDSNGGGDNGGGDNGGDNNVDGGVWDRLAQCESGGNWSINTGNGYYGGLQFSLQTWRAYGGSGYPHENSKAEQIRIAEKVRSARGHYGDWPACARKLGLPTS